jgi:hypothetical protein
MSGLTVPLITSELGMLGAALEYAQAGWYITPARRCTKDPGSVLGKGWQTRTSRDPEVIVSWYAGTDHGIALHAGRSGAIVLDIDNPANLHEDIRRAVTEHGLVPFQQTRPDTDPGRGHLIFQQPDGRMLGNGVGTLGKGWGEVRGKNGVIIAAPTEHPDGGRYWWHTAGPVPVLPRYVADHLTDAVDADAPATDEQVRRFLDGHRDAERVELLDVHVHSFAKKVTTGESRHDTMVGALTGALKEAAAGLIDASAAADTLGGLFLSAVVKPGVGKQGAARSPAQARSEWAGILAWAVAQAAAADPAATRARAAEKIPPQPTAVDADPFANAITFAELDTKTYPAPTYLVDKILPRGGITLLAGAPKIGKSYLALGVALAVAQNGTALGRLQVNNPGEVLFISLDDQNPARAQQRARQIGKGPLPSAAVLHVEPNLGRGEQARDAIGRYLNRHPQTALVVIDTLTHLRGDRGSTEGVYDADVRFMATLRTLLDGARYTILCLAHVRKERADDGVMAISGTYGVTGGADSLIILTGNRHATGRAIEVVSRDDEGCELALTFTEHGLFVTDEDPHDPALFLVPDDARVYRAVKDFGEGGVTAAELTGALGATGGTKTGDRLARLAKHGVLRRLGRGRYAAD